MHRLVGETQQINRWSWERRENYARFKMAEALDIRLQKPNKVRLDKKKKPRCILRRYLKTFKCVCLVQLKRCWTKRTSLNDNTRAMLLYFIQTFPPCVSVQPITGAGQDSGHDQAWQTASFFFLFFFFNL